MSPRGQYQRKPKADVVTESAPATKAAVVGTILTAKTKALVDAIRKPFTDFSEGYALLTTNRRELAPRFMRAFEAWKGEMNGTFAAFVRVLVPSVPEARDDYRAHPAYQAADYLRRLGGANERDVEVVPIEDRPATPYIGLARLWATLVPLIDPEGTVAHRLLEAIAKELNWTEQQVERIESLAQSQGPVKLSPAVKKQLTSRAA